MDRSLPSRRTVAVHAVAVFAGLVYAATVEFARWRLPEAVPGRE